MNPLAAAFLAAQGWDGSQGISGQKQANGLYVPNGNQVQQSQLNQNGSSTDFQSLLNNRVILQALSSQMMHGSFPLPDSNASPTLPSMANAGNAFTQNPTPSQTTRSGRVSRPPVAAPMQDQLSMLQQILGAPNDITNQQHGPSRQQQPVPPPTRHHLPQSVNQASQLRTAGTKRPHSALRDTSNAPYHQSAPDRLREASPLVRPVPDNTGGRPRKEDPTSNEERMERRRIKNSQSAADYRRKKELYIQSLEDRVREKELEIKSKTEECEKWRQKFVDMEKEHVVLAALWTAAGFTLPNDNGIMQLGDNVPPSAPNMQAPQLVRPPIPSSSAGRGIRTIPEARNAPSMSPASMNPPIRSPLPLASAQNTPHVNLPSPAQQPTPLASASSTLAAGLPPMNHPTMSPLTTLPGSSPVDTPDNQPFDFGIDMSAFDDFFNWDIMPDNDADDQQDADFVPASSPKRDSDSGTDEEGASEQGQKKRKKRKGKSKQKTRKQGQGEDDDDFVDPEEDEEDLFMPITDVEVPPGQMQLVEEATQNVMSTFGVDSQVQLTGVMQKIVDAGDGLTGEQLEKMKSVLRWMQMSGHLPGHQ